MKTIVYIDGYNLYYGCLKGTPYKWLDLVRLFSKFILPSVAPASTHIDDFSIKLFTADILDRAAKSSDSVRDQKSYFHGLKSSGGEQITIIKGYYFLAQVRARGVDKSEPKKAPKYCDDVCIWKLEEKQSDVNLAIESLYDAITNIDLEQVVFVTNDTDLVPALKKIKELGNKKVGLVIPTTKGDGRKPNSSLVKYADWVRAYITEDELQQSQLSRVIHTNGRKFAIKPESWFGEPSVVSEIIKVLLPVYGGKRNKCWQWLETEKPKVENIPELSDIPINLLDDPQSAKLVLEHAKAYAAYMQLQNQ